MTTDKATETPDAGSLLGLGSSEGLGAVSEAHCYVHVHAPQPDAFGISRHHCPTCNRRTYMLWRHTPWYGTDDACLRCGEEWQDGERAERPFAPRWRERNKEAARTLYRRLRSAAPNVRANLEPTARGPHE